MTPQEKAQQLVDKYSMITKWKMGIEQEYVIKKAKECALIAVDEIINIWEYSDTQEKWWWQQVKEELEKL